MKKSIMLFLTIMITGFVFAQQTAKLEDGRVVLLNDDGTWEYKQDSPSTPTVKIASSECEKLIQTSVDRMTGTETTKFKKPMTFLKSSNEWLTVDVNKIKSDYGLVMMVTSKNNCVTAGDKIFILYRDGTRAEFENVNEFNCDGMVIVFFFGGEPSEKLADLGNKEIEAIRVITSNSFVEVKLKNKQSKKIMESINCITQ